ncbi:MAG: DUF3127 domain-containing protein [Prevotella sp.]|jgi:hypothetical protein|nr:MULTISPECIES: DUF3127 domain-containing protein [unclassified Prevotella]MCH3969368.1 DUF3127 domain-containing protein [Prevotella sp.]MCH3991788.1 DUF3127 domain-containing protein [Prevotella sp.]MCH4017656.1 DUF3127 domain-containing protein [Prevotella sp.]MCH4186912.1 DUF3127 domain-containing protein [Prevotella sp.]MCH4216924.1 DUF3127 domain-containing protein [Prevotella sp.]
MEIQGKIIAVLPKQSGTSKRTGNQWASQDYVIETHEQYPRKCAFRVFGEDKINQFAIKSGEELTVSFDIDAHEYQGRWFNNINAWQVQRVDPAAVQASVQGNQPQDNAAPLAGGAPASGAQAPFPPSSDGDSGADDLPF